MIHDFRLTATKSTGEENSPKPYPPKIEKILVTYECPNNQRDEKRKTDHPSSAWRRSETAYHWRGRGATHMVFGNSVSNVHLSLR